MKVPGAGLVQGLSVTLRTMGRRSLDEFRTEHLHPPPPLLQGELGQGERDSLPGQPLELVLRGRR